MYYLHQLHLQAHIFGLLCFGTQLRVTVSTPPPGYVKKVETDLSPPKYEFGYEVKDGGGGKQGHLEARDGEFALGKYYVRLPDGSDQKVNYFADDWGYHSLVEYNNASPSSSSSAQFAMGEKAVAALMKTLNNVKESEVSNLIQRLSHKEETRVAENSDTSATVVTPLTSSNSVTSNGLNSVLYEKSQSSASTLSYPIKEPHFVTVSTESPTLQPNPVTATPPSLTTVTQYQNVNYRSDDDTRLTAPQYAAVIGLRNNYEHFESQKTDIARPQTVTSNYVDENFQESTERVVTIGGKSKHKSQYSSSASASLSGQGPTNNNLQITSYLANNDAAIDVSSGGSNDRASVIPLSDSGGPTTISAFLIAEDDRKIENEISRDTQQYGISSTVSPIRKEPFGPIIVPNQSDNLGYYEEHVSTTEPNHFSDSLNTEELSRLKTLFNFNTSTGHNGIRYNIKSNLGINLDVTPAPTPEPVLVTPREEINQLTASDQVLAPIQAAVSLSASTVKLPVTVNYNEGKSIDSSDTVVEQQTLKEESVYKTVIDVQKSIPFEIPDGNNNYDNSVPEETRDNGQSYQQGVYHPIHQSINEEFGKVGSEQSPPNQEQFLNKVILAYQKLSNNNIPDGSAQTQVWNNGHNQNVQLTPTVTPTVSQNNLYYVYLQRYNPSFNRYGIQPQQTMLYHLPYANALPIPNPKLVPEEYINYNNVQMAPGFSHTRAKFVQASGLNMGYSSFINHGDYGQKYFTPQPDQKNNNVAPSVFKHDIGSNLPSQPSYNIQILKDDHKINNDISTNLNFDSSNLNVIQSDVQLNNNGFLNNPVNTLYANNLNALKTYQKYMQNTLPTNTNVHGVDTLTSESLIGSELVAENNNRLPISGVTSIPHQSQQFSDGTKIQNVDYSVPVPNPSPVPHLPIQVQKAVSVTKVVPLTYPSAFPLPPQITVPYPQPYNVPATQYIPYPTMLPLAFKQYHPLLVYAKKDTNINDKKPVQEQHQNHQLPFRPSQKLYHSVYPPETYYVTEYMKTNSRTRGLGKKLCIEYGGFKPPMVPSVQIGEKLEHQIIKKSDKLD